MKRKSIIIGLVAVLIIVIIGGYFVWSYYIGHPSAEQVRNMTMAYIKAHHNETAQYMQSFSWTGGPAYLGETGVASYSYQSTGWNITIFGGVVTPSIFAHLLPISYSVTATYTSQVAPGEVIVSWQGTMQNGVITQTAYTFNP